MNRLAFGIGLFTLLANTGCLHFQPVGPLAKSLGTTNPANPEPGVTVAATQDAPHRPIVQAAPAPPTPALLVTPGEVNEQNYQQITRRLMEELELDRKAMESMPRVSEVSVIKK